MGVLVGVAQGLELCALAPWQVAVKENYAILGGVS